MIQRWNLALLGCLCVAVTLAHPLAVNTVRADDRDPRDLLARAIRAHGGEAALKKALLCKRTDTGKLGDLPFVSQVTRSLPGKFRLEITLNKRLTIKMIVDEDRGWQSEGGGPASAILPNRLKEMREEAYVWWIATLVPLNDPGFTLTSVPESKIESEPIVGFKVERKGYADSTLYFNKKSGLLVRIDRQATEAGLKVDKEYVYADHKAFAGVQLPTREIVKVNRRASTEISVSEYQFPATIEASVFAKP